MVKFKEALKSGKKLLCGQIDDYEKQIKKGFDETEENLQFEVTLALKFKRQDEGKLKVLTGISFITEKVKDTAEEILTDQPDMFNEKDGE